MLPLAAQRREAALAAYRGGTGTLAAVLEARRAELDATLSLLQGTGRRAGPGPGSLRASRHGAIMKNRSLTWTRRADCACAVVVAAAVAAWRRLLVRYAAGPARWARRRRFGAAIGADRRAARRAAHRARRRRPQGALLARSDGARPEIRQAGQEPRSWTCSSCRSTPTARGRRRGDDQPAARAELRRPHRSSEPRERSTRASRAVGARHRRARDRRRAGAHPGLRREAATCARSTTACAPASRSPSCTSPTGSAAQEELLALKASAQPGAAELVDAARAAPAPARHARRRDRARRARRQAVGAA